MLTNMARLLGKKEQAELTRRRILDAAIKLFAKKGYASTSMTDLAGAVKMTPGVLYWHFDDKEALLAAALEELERRFASELVPRTSDKASAPLPEDPRERARILIHRVAEVVDRNHDLMMMVGVIGAETTGANPRIERSLRRAYGAVANLTTSVLVRGRDAGLIDASTDIACAAQMFLGLYMGGIMHQRLFRDDFPLARALPELERMLLGALFPAPAPTRTRGRG